MIGVLRSGVRLGGRRRGVRGVRGVSYRHQGGEASLVYRTVGGVLEEAAREFGERTACVSSHQGKRVSFREAKEQADALAAGILSMGVEKGDRVGIWAPNSLEWYITSFALAQAGIISVYLNPAYQAREVRHCINAVEMKMLVTTESFKSQDYPRILEEVAPGMAGCEAGKTRSARVPSLESVVCISERSIPGMVPFQRVMEGGTEESRRKLRKVAATVSPEDASNIQFTSGTTGSPKGAVLSHFHIVNNSRMMCKRQNLREKSHVMCLMGPLFHAMGSVIGVLNCLLSGATLVLPEGAFSPTNAAKAIAHENCTILLGTPTMYVDVIKVSRETATTYATPELAVTGGAFAPVQLLRDIRDTFGVQRVASVYGLTETGPVTFMSLPDEDFDRSATTVGFLMDHTEAKVVDEGGQAVPWGRPGELWVRGYCVMKGYWGEAEKTRETVTEERWLRTGDQFAMTEDGYGRVVGRIKDMIIRGGENIYPAEVEEFLSSHPEVVDVQVIGVPDERLGEQVCACIRLAPGSTLTEEDVKRFCKGKIADYKVPYYVQVMEEFPKTSSGKVQKYLLKTQVAELLKLDAKADLRGSHPPKVPTTATAAE